MDEKTWLASSDPKPMLEYLRNKASDRQLRLFMVACCLVDSAITPMPSNPSGRMRSCMILQVHHDRGAVCDCLRFCQ